MIRSEEQDPCHDRGFALFPDLQLFSNSGSGLVGLMVILARLMVIAARLEGKWEKGKVH